MLSDMIKSPTCRPPMIVIYGEPGAGKTTIGTTFPDPIFLNFEPGGLRAHNVAEIPIDGIPTLVDAVVALKTEKHPYQTVVVDTIDRLEELATTETCKALHIQKLSQAKYGEGYIQRAEKVNKMVDQICGIGINTVILAHSQMVSMVNPETEPYGRTTIKIDKRSAAHIVENADMIGYISLELSSEDGRATVIGGRKVRVGYSPAYLSKIRVMGAPTQLPCNGADILKVFTAADTKKTGVKQDESK